MRNNTTNTVRQILAAVDKAGASLPKGAATAHAEIVDLAAKVATLDTRADLAGVVLACLERGDDPITDPAVHAEVVRLRIAESGVGLESALSERAQTFLDNHAADILESLRAPFNKAAKALAEAHDRLDGAELEDAAGILRKGGDAAHVWADAKNAEATIQQIRQAIGVLSGATYAARQDPQYRLLWIADVPPGDFLDHGLRNKGGMSAWDVLRNGWTLDLADTETLAERVAAVHTEAEQRQAQPGRDALADYRRLRGALTS